MRRLYLSLSTLVAAGFIAGCSGNGGAPIASAPTSSLPATKTSAGNPSVYRLLHLRHTPLPYHLHHRITAAQRARALAGGWTPVTQKPPVTNGADTELLMTDGTVMVHDYCTSNWYALAPDKTGNYINGTWTKAASMPSNYAPLYHSSAVLADGKLIVQGGEYNGTGCQTAETNLGAIYDPFANSWTAVTGPSGWSEIGDAQSAVLSNGTYMLGNCCQSNQAQLNESSMTWTIVSSGKADTNSEEGWTLLRNGDLLTADVFGAPNTELFNPSSSSWSSAGNTPDTLTSGFEIGPQVLRPNNTVFVAGATGNTAIYNANTGTWATGPTFPKLGSQQLDTADAPGALLVNGRVMVVASPGLYTAPSSFYVFDGKNLLPIASPPNAPNDPSYVVRLLMLPTGQILQTDDSTDVEVYTAGHHAHAGTTPSITSAPSSVTPGDTYTIKGKRLNGVSQGNMYGDDVQQASNYPLVRIVNNSTGHVFYARTHGHSFMGVGSNQIVSTNFDVPSGIETGASTVYVVVNGVTSAGVSVTVT